MMTANQFRAVIIAGYAALAGLTYLAIQGHVWAKVVLAVICLPVFVWLFVALGIGGIQAISRRRVRAEVARLYGEDSNFEDAPRSVGIAILRSEGGEDR